MKSYSTITGPHWLSALRRFAVITFLGHLIWEAAHIPLYTIWVEGTWGEIIFAAVHCTGGDLLIAMSSILLALFFFGTGSWPAPFSSVPLHSGLAKIREPRLAWVRERSLPALAC